MANEGRRTLSTEVEISAYLHRSRMAILRALRDGPATASQIGAKLGVHPANLTRHIRVLEGAGLVALVEKRDTGRNVEKYYAAAAARFDVAPDTANLTAPHKIALAYARSQLSAALVELPEESADPVVAVALGVRISPENAGAFAAELAELGRRFGAADQTDGRPYEIVLALYPGEGAASDTGESIRLTTRKRTPR